MKEYNLQDLPYPMFELTEEEIEMLLEINDEVLGVAWGFLCNAINQRHRLKPNSMVLISKIRVSIGNSYTLNDWMYRKLSDRYFTEINHRDSVHHIMRQIWITKLIEFNKGK